jgi:hypothetical protein
MIEQPDSRLRRPIWSYLEAAAFVGIWMGAGWGFRLDAYRYLLVGVPLSLCWRGSGTLVMPAAAHALIDA